MTLIQTRRNIYYKIGLDWIVYLTMRPSGCEAGTARVGPEKIFSLGGTNIRSKHITKVVHKILS